MVSSLLRELNSGRRRPGRHRWDRTTITHDLMTRSSVAYSSNEDSAAAGRELGESVCAGFDGESPDALIVFASSSYDYTTLLTALKEACSPGILVGCSSAGEFISHQHGTQSASAIGLRSDEIEFSAGIGRGVSRDRDAVVAEMISDFHGIDNVGTRFSCAMVLTDALAGHADDLIGRLNVATGATYQIFGGGAGDDAQFSRTHVFFGTEAVSDAAVALEMLSSKPIGIGVNHGWVPAGRLMRVTESDGARLISIDAMPAREAFEEYAEESRQRFDRNDALPFFLHNVIGIEAPGGFKLRVPLAINDDDSVSCAAEIPTGATITFMKSSVASAAEAASTAVQSALGQLGGSKPAVALFFDCVATRLRTGDGFGLELDALDNALGGAKYAGCNTYGQIARADGQFSGFHNCTATVCVLPE